MILFRVPLNCSQTVLSVVDLSASFAFDAYMQIFREISYAEPLIPETTLRIHLARDDPRVLFYANDV